VAVLWRGDREARRSATPKNNRFHQVFEALAALGIHAEPAVYGEDFADDIECGSSEAAIGRQGNRANRGRSNAKTPRRTPRCADGATSAVNWLTIRVASRYCELYTASWWSAWRVGGSIRHPGLGCV
jgi:hypothetical protein